ncbi:hypothetical protein FA13DRAFT_855737 [Coprinellus micaceus]|uniref:Uncharacterized protein n=1 Tax=Coprinellus micaceus TaxID=71717 RepID=A0A4Y7T0S5_COPMI|nr:hypothetical protein FA13DRAFT_855737 [Coprinellus micaceus]
MASDPVKTVPAGSSPRPDPSASRQSATTQLPPYTSSSSPRGANPRTSTNPHTLRPATNPRLKLTLPPPPYPYTSAEVLPGNSVRGGEDALRNEDVGEHGQWFWYEGKRVYVRGNHRRVQSNTNRESPMESSESLPPPEDKDVEMNIGDDEYDCGYAMDLGAESPSPSIGGTPGLGSRSSSSSLFAPSISSSSSISSQDAWLAESITRKPGGAGAVYKREVECQEEADDRLTREWAVAAGIASVAVEPMLAGKRSRGPSVSAAYPPVTGSTQVSRRSSRSAPQWDETDRDCGICFEYAVRPARTVCCGKLFCQEHLEDVSHSLSV